MSINKPEKTYQNLWMAIAFILGFWFLFYHENEGKRFLKAIKNHQIDTIGTGDSVYVIKAKIDTVYYENQHDQGDAPDNR